MWWVEWLALDIFRSAPVILKMVQKVRLKMFSLKMVAYSMSLVLLSTLNFFDEQVGWTILDHSCFLNFFVGILLHALMIFLLKMVN